MIQDEGQMRFKSLHAMDIWKLGMSVKAVK